MSEMDEALGDSPIWCDHEGWWAYTKKGELIGPFRTEVEAENALRQLA